LLANVPKDNPLSSAEACALYYFPEIPCGGEKGSAGTSTRGHFVSGAHKHDGDGSSANGERKDSDPIRSRIEEAFNQGFDQGRAETIAAQQKKVDQALGALRAALDQMTRIRQRDIGCMETETVRLALAIAQKIIGHEIAYGSIIGHVVKAAMKKVSDPRHLTLRLNPKDVDAVNGLQRESPADEFGSGWRVEADESIQRGGCMIETKLGDVDARIEQQIKIIAELLTDQLPKPITEE
jgi:flagellar assembly protein FliH